MNKVNKLAYSKIRQTKMTRKYKVVKIALATLNFKTKLKFIKVTQLKTTTNFIYNFHLN